MASYESSILYVVTHPMAVHNLLRRELLFLSKCGWRVDLACGSYDPDASHTIPCPVHCVPMSRTISPLRDALAVFRMASLIRKLRPRIVAASTPKGGLIGIVAAAMTGVPVRVYVLRGLRLETARGPLRAALTVTERLACGCAHRVLCVSPSLRRRALELRLSNARKLTVLGSGSSTGVDCERFSPDSGMMLRSARIRANLGIPEHAPVIGYVGRLAADKGIIDLLQAFGSVRKQIPEAYLLLVGDFDDTDPLPAAVLNALKNDPRVLVTGWVNDTAPYYPLMHVLALPTYREGFPNVALEAAASGKPVIGTKATGVVDAVLHGVTGILSSTGDAGNFANNLVAILSDPNLARRLGEAGRNRAVREFSSDIVLPRLVSFYSALYNDGKSSSPNDVTPFATADR